MFAPTGKAMDTLRAITQERSRLHSAAGAAERELKVGTGFNRPTRGDFFLLSGGVVEYKLLMGGRE